MDIIFSVIREDTFWRILTFLHYLISVPLLAVVTLQAVAVFFPAHQEAGNFIGRISPVPAASYTMLIVLLYVPVVLLGAWIYLKYRLYVRIPMEQFRHWWTVGAFEFKEHMTAMGLGLLPAYWYLWRPPLSERDAALRKWLTILLAVSVWYSFVTGHVANDFRGVGS